MKSTVNGISDFLLPPLSYFLSPAPPIYVHSFNHCEIKTHVRATCSHLHAAEWMMTPTSNEQFLRVSRCEAREKSFFLPSFT